MSEKITCPKCKKTFQVITNGVDDVRHCPYCGYGGFKIDKITCDDKQIWPSKV